MKRDEAIKVLEGLVLHEGVSDPQAVTAINVAIGAMEREGKSGDILRKVRQEIKRANADKPMRFWDGLREAGKIIDKYAGEENDEG